MLVKTHCVLDIWTGQSEAAALNQANLTKALANLIKGLCSSEIIAVSTKGYNQTNHAGTVPISPVIDPADVVVYLSEKEARKAEFVDDLEGGGAVVET
jgi:hypothetical protein